MNAWMTLWTILLAGGVLGMIGLLLFVTAGAVRELRESLNELSATSSPESSDAS